MILSRIALATALFAGLSGAALAADLYLEEAAPVVVESASGWEGFYAGIFGGYSSGTLTTTDNFVTSPYEEDYEGYLVGLQAGYNFYLSDEIVGGFAADIAYNTAETDDPSYVTSFGWTGSATARLGLDLGILMPYALAGVSFAGADVADFPAVEESQTHIGYTVGLGVAAMVADNLSVNAEYRYTNYGTQIYDLTHVTTAEFADHSVRAGLNLHFD
jgi:outer membrane immunogenic protein